MIGPALGNLINIEAMEFTGIVNDGNYLQKLKNRYLIVLLIHTLPPSLGQHWKEVDETSALDSSKPR